MMSFILWVTFGTLSFCFCAVVVAFTNYVIYKMKKWMKNK
jgi:hypothetical protein